jgi:hypothetical protein
VFTRRHWSVIADAGDGLWVPALAAALLTEKLDRGDLGAGARTGFEVLDLADFRAAFSQFKIRDATEETAIAPSPFRRWLGAAVDPVIVLRNLDRGDHAQVFAGMHPALRVVAERDPSRRVRQTNPRRVLRAQWAND